MPTTSTAFLSAVLASRSKYFCKFTLEAAASNESPFLQTACCPQHINNYRDPKCEVLSMYFPTPGKFLFSSHVWNSGLAQKERAWGGGGLQSYPHKAVCFLSLGFMSDHTFNVASTSTSSITHGCGHPLSSTVSTWSSPGSIFHVFSHLLVYCWFSM